MHILFIWVLLRYFSLPPVGDFTLDKLTFVVCIIRKTILHKHFIEVPQHLPQS